MGKQKGREIKVIYEFGKPESTGPSSARGVDPSRHNDILLHSTKGSSR